MSNEEYIKLIIRMLKKIDNNNSIKLIFNYVHRIFIRQAGK